MVRPMVLPSCRKQQRRSVLLGSAGVAINIADWEATHRETLHVSQIGSKPKKYRSWTARENGTDVLLGARLGSGGSVDVGPFDVASTPSGKSRLAAIAAGGSQCVLAWGDDRIDAGDIFAQNVNGDGSLGDAAVWVPALDTIVQLGAPRPNPSHGTIHIPVDGVTAVTVFDVAGHRIRTLRSSGDSDLIVWDGRDRDGRDVAAGMYFLRATRGSVTATRRVSVIR